MSTKFKGQLLAWVELTCQHKELLTDPAFAQLIGDTLHMLHEDDAPLTQELEDYPNVISLSTRRG